jgi:hypothetical protein
MMDEFERDFQKLREDVRTVKDKLNQRQDLIKTLTQVSSQSITLRNQIEKRLTECFESLLTLKS